MACHNIMILSLLAVTFTLVIAFEPSPLQDFCVADPTSSGLDISLLPLLGSQFSP